MQTLQTYQGEYLWRYIPSLPLAITFTILFALATAAHTWKMVKTRMWFCLPFVFGGLSEVLGYATRAVSSKSTGALGPYLIQAIFLVLPPVFFAASLYMVYSRVVRSVHGERFSLLTPRTTTIVFVLGDLACLNIQSTGSSLLAHPKQEAIGNWIIVAGLGLQVVTFAVFMVSCVVFHRRMRAHVKAFGIAEDVPWEASLNMLYATSMAILIRNVFRVAEFVMGKEGYLSSTEWPAYAFDGALMLLVMGGFYVWYPSELRLSARDSAIELLGDADESSTECPQPTEGTTGRGASWWPKGIYRKTVSASARKG